MGGTKGWRESPEKWKKHIVEGGFERFEGNSAQELRPRRCIAEKDDTSWANLGERQRCGIRHKAEGLEATFMLSVWCRSNPPRQMAPRVHCWLETCGWTCSGFHWGKSRGVCHLAVSTGQSTSATLLPQISCAEPCIATAILELVPELRGSKWCWMGAQDTAMDETGGTVEVQGGRGPCCCTGAPNLGAHGPKGHLPRQVC